MVSHTVYFSSVQCNFNRFYFRSHWKDHWNLEKYLRCYPELHKCCLISRELWIKCLSANNGLDLTFFFFFFFWGTVIVPWNNNPLYPRSTSRPNSNCFLSFYLACQGDFQVWLSLPSGNKIMFEITLEQLYGLEMHALVHIIFSQIKTELFSAFIRVNLGF